MADVRTVTYTVKYPNGDPWVGGVLLFRLKSGGFEAGGLQQPGATIESDPLDANGAGSITLWQDAGGVNATGYMVTMPDGAEYEFSVPDADTPIDLSTLLGA